MADSIATDQPKVLVLTTSFPRFPEDEAAVFVGRLIDAFSDEGLGGVLVIPHDDQEPLSEQRKRFTIHRFRYGIFSKGALAFGNGILPNLRQRWWLIFQAPLMLLQYILIGWRHRNEWQVIHANWIATAIPAFFLSIITRRPYVLTVRGEDIKLLRSSFRILLLPFVKNAAAITAVSHDFEAELKTLIPDRAHLISAIPNGVTRYTVSDAEQEMFREQHQLQKEWTLISYISRVVPMKRPEFLIDLLSHLASQNFHLVLAGRVDAQYRKQLEQYAADNKVDSHLHILGTIPPKNVGALLALSSFYLSASTHEGRSNSILEALAAGVPSCVSRISGHEELVQDNENGLLFNLDNPKHTAEKILELHTDSKHYEKLSVAAKRSVEQLTWQCSSQTFSSVFKQLLAPNSNFSAS